MLRSKLLKNDQTKILRDILVRVKVEKKAVVIWKKEQEKLEECQDLRQQLKRLWGLNKNSGPRGHRGTLGCDSQAGGVPPASKRIVLGTARNSRTLKLPDLW